MPRKQDRPHARTYEQWIATLDNSEKLAAVFRFPGLLDLAEAIPVPARGRSWCYPPLLHLAVMVVSRVYGSQEHALKELNKSGVWAQLVDEFAAMTGDPGPYRHVPPTADQQDNFVRRFINEPKHLTLAAQLFTPSAVGLARILNQFPEGVVPDWANPSIHNLAFGDGSVLAAFSDVRIVQDQVTGLLHAVGSRSKTGNPRVQTTVSNTAADNKSVRGLNMVSVSTWTDFGWIVLAVDIALGAEANTARELITQVHTHLGSTLHTIAWDRALSGWIADWLMADLRVQLIGKAVALGKKKIAGYQPLRLSKGQAVVKFLAGQDLPLGTSVYPTTKGHDFVRSMFVHFGQPLGVNCAHDLWIDDEALWDVTVGSDGHLYKRARATVVTSVPFTRPDGRFGRRDTWRLPCPNCGVHIFTTESRPRSRQNEPIGRGMQRALSALRPVPRADLARFGRTAGRRNITEAINSWLKTTFQVGAGKPRGRRLDATGQALDHLCAGVLANALTYDFYLYTQALHGQVA